MRRLALLIALALPASAGAQAPDEDPFYAAPAGFEAAKPGTVFASREIAVNLYGVPLPYEGHQLSYRTTDTKGKPVVTVATVLLPPSPSGKLVALQPPEDSLTRRCASSYEIRQGSSTDLQDAVDLMDRTGAAVVVPDYEGPESHWVAGGMAAHGVLDAIRATESFAPAGLDGAKTPVAMWGYSGGGHATAWAAELQPEYAPELNVVGAAHGGAPYSLRATVANMDGHPAAGILLAAVVGISRAYPEMRIDDVLNDRGKAMRDAIGDDCLEEFAGAYPLARLDDYTVEPNAVDLPHVAAVIADNDLGQRIPKAPLYVYHSATDELNPIAGTDKFVDNYCARGAVLHYERAPVGEHIEFAARGGAGASAWIVDRLAGKPAPNDCPPLPPAKRCRITLKLPRRDGERVRRVAVRVGGKRVVVRRGRNLKRVRVTVKAGRRTLRLRLRSNRGNRRVKLVRDVNC